MKRLLSIPFAAVLLSQSSYSEEVLFQLKYEAGKQYLTETLMEQSATMQMGGQAITSAGVTKVITSQTVSKIEKGLQIEQKIESMKIEMEAMGMKMSYDSENPEGQMAQMMGPMMDVESTLTLGADSKVIDVQVKTAPGMENFGMGEDEIKQSARELYDLMPNKKVEEGGSWQVTTPLPLGSMLEKPASVTFDLKFEGMVEKDGRKLAKIVLKGEVSDEDENMDVVGKEVSGEILFDPEAGLAREMTMTLDLEIGVPEGVEVQEGAAGKMPMRSVSKSKLLEIK